MTLINGQIAKIEATGDDSFNEPDCTVISNADFLLIGLSAMLSNSYWCKKKKEKKKNQIGNKSIGKRHGILLVLTEVALMDGGFSYYSRIQDATLLPQKWLVIGFSVEKVCKKLLLTYCPNNNKSFDQL